MRSDSSHIFECLVLAYLHFTVMSDRTNLDGISNDFTSVCRLCCSSKGSMVSIFAAHFSRKVMSLAAVQIWDTDGLPGQICNDCIVMLDVSFRFRKQCERSEYILRQKKAQMDEITNRKIRIEAVNTSGKNFEFVECTPDLSLTAKHNQNYYSKNDLGVSLMDVANIHNIKQEMSTELDYKCDVCFKIFGSKTKLSKHLPIHSGCKPYQCGVCKKAFTTNSNLKAHGKLHSEDRPFVCHICQKGCKRLKDLELHTRKHTGERPYGCDICGKAFTSSSNLRAHTRIHTGEKPYVCPICQKAFCQSNELSKHRKTHNKEKRACEVCNKTFTGEAALLGHIITHNDEKSNNSSMCYKNFTTSSDLGVHLQLHQAGEMGIS